MLLISGPELALGGLESTAPSFTPLGLIYGAAKQNELAVRNEVISFQACFPSHIDYFSRQIVLVPGLVSQRVSLFFNGKNERQNGRKN